MKESLLVALISKRIALTRYLLLLFAAVLGLCVNCKADSIETIGIPGGSLVVAMYSGFGQTQWDSRYLLPEHIDRNGLWKATEVVFDMPQAGGSFSLETTDSGFLSADIFGTGIGELWSFNALALPDDPIDFNISFEGADISTVVLDPPPQTQFPNLLPSYCSSQAY
jgi:hypothetical protein